MSSDEERQKRADAARESAKRAQETKRRNEELRRQKIEELDSRQGKGKGASPV